jgi:uncharacterized protein YbjT (DUF2867 family)
MNVLLFGATGMVGDAVLHECLADDRVASVVALTRSPLGMSHPKLRELRRTDFYSYDDLAAELATIDACFFCLGVSAIGLSEQQYHHQTFDLTLAAARALAAAHPGAVFCYVSGEGTDSTEKGRAMWARVKGATENALRALPLKAYMFRPGFIRRRAGGPPSKTLLYRIGYAFVAPLYPLLRRLAPTHMTTAENVGRAMIAAAERGYTTRVLENVDINALGGRAT